MQAAQVLYRDTARLVESSVDEFSRAVSSTGAAWPELCALGLLPQQRELRRLGIGGSDANTIMSGDPVRVLQLWHEKRGEAAEEDLSHVLQVMLGCWTESFNKQWYEQQTGLEVSACGSGWTSLTHPWRRSTVDGLAEAKSAIWEAKHTSAFAKADEVLSRYMPQLQHNMAVCGLELGILSVLYGNSKWECYEVASDWLYQDELLAAEERFWACVRSGEPPVAVAPPPPPKPVAYRELSFEGNNAWAVAAGTWIADLDASKRHAACVKELKELVADDVSRAFGHGIEIRRSKAGALSIRELAR